MGIIRFAINNPIKVAVMVLLLGLFGLLSLFRIPIQLTPNVDRPLITVTTGWEGASPQEVEDNIIRRQEEKLKGLPGLVKMTSSSRDNVGEIQLEFAVGTDKNVALREVSDRLRQVSGYEDREAIDEPVVVATDTAMATPIAWLIFRAHGHDVTTYQDFVEDNVKPILERVPGVASVDVYGGREQEVQVIVDPARLAARGLTFAELERALRMHNVDISAGTITQGKRDLAVRTIGKYESLQQVLNTVVADRPGGPNYVRDVARAVKSYKKPLGFVRSEGEPVLAMPVRRETGTNVLQVMAGLRAAIDKINRQILSGPRDYMELVQVYDETKYINSAIDLVEQNIVLGGLLAIIVLMVFLRSPSATLVVAVSIPVSVVGTFLAVSLLGRNLNVVMLAGMAFAVGMVVDAAVVVLENIYRHRQMGKDRLEAALDGTREVWGAVLAGALTTMAVFIPVLTVQQEAGQLFRDIAVAIASAVGLSLVVTVTVIPSLSARILGRTGAATTGRRLRDLPHSKQFWLIAVGPVALVPLSLVLISNRAAMLVLTAWLGWLALCLLGFVGQRARPEASRFTRWVAAAVYWINGRVWARLAVVGGLTGASLYLSWRLIPPQTYLPNGNRNMVFGMLFSPPGYSLDEFDRIGRIIEPALAPYWQCEPGSPQHQQLSRQWQQLYQRQIRPTMQQQIERIDRQLAALQQQLARASGQQRSMLQGQINSLRRKRGELSLVMNEMAVSPPPIDHFFYVAYMGRAFMGTISKQEGVVKPVANLLNVIGRKIPDCYAVFIQPSIFGFRSSGNSLEVDVRGDDLQKVAAAAGALFAACAGRFGDPPEASPINFARGRHEVRFRPNQEKAKDVGLTVRDVGFIIRAAVDGAIVGEFRDRGKTIDLTLKLAGTANQPPK
ncbi:MAG: efflux RND transporter permease subunit, partial [Phycisphaerae bacterium]